MKKLLQLQGTAPYYSRGLLPSESDPQHPTMADALGPSLPFSQPGSATWGPWGRLGMVGDLRFPSRRPRTSHVVTLLFWLVVNLTAMGQTAKLAVCSPSTAAASACSASTRPSLPASLHAFIPLGVAHLLLRRAAKGRSSRPANGFLQEIPNPGLCRNGFSPHVIIICTPSERPSPSPSPWNKVQAIAMEGSSHVQGRVTMQRRATPTPKATSRSTTASLLQPDAMPWKAKQHLHIGGYKNILYFETEDSRVMVATMV